MQHSGSLLQLTHTTILCCRSLPLSLSHTHTHTHTHTQTTECFSLPPLSWPQSQASTVKDSIFCFSPTNTVAKAWPWQCFFFPRESAGLDVHAASHRAEKNTSTRVKLIFLKDARNALEILDIYFHCNDKESTIIVTSDTFDVNGCRQFIARWYYY